MRTILLLATLALPLAAQSAGFTPDRPAAARAALRRAAEAQRDGRSDAALTEALAAAEAWPVQPAYTEAALRLATAAGDTATVARLLGRLAALESGQAALEAPALTALAARSPAVTAAREALARALRASGPVQAITIPDTTWFPEGLARDPVTGTLYLSSLRHRTIGWLTPEGTLRPFLAPTSPAPLAPFALVVDSARRVLYAATGVAPAIMIASAENAADRGDVMTSSPGPIPSARRVSAIASVPVPTPTAWRAPDAAANSSSKADSSGPRMNQPRSMTRSIAWRTAAASGPGPSVMKGTRKVIPACGGWYRHTARSAPGSRPVYGRIPSEGQRQASTPSCP